MKEDPIVIQNMQILEQISNIFEDKKCTNYNRLHILTCGILCILHDLKIDRKVIKSFETIALLTIQTATGIKPSKH